MDAPFTLRCGAALAMVPLPVVEEALRRDELPESLVENVREVANILARLLNSPSTPHLRLHALHQLPTELTPAVEALLGSPEFRRDFALTIRSEEHTSELQSLMRISYAVFCLKKKNNNKKQNRIK